MSFFRSKPPTDVGHRMTGYMLFSIKNCRGNGDPDRAGRPRQDDDTLKGLFSSVALKRRLRDEIFELRGDDPRYQLYITRGAVLSRMVHFEAKAGGIALAEGPEEEPAEDEGKKGKKNGKKFKVTIESERELLRRLLGKYVDPRLFGQVWTDLKLLSQCKGPIQFDWAESMDPIEISKNGIARVAIQSEDEAESNLSHSTFGDSWRVRFGLYGVSFWYSPRLAKKNAVTSEDLQAFFEALVRLFESKSGSNLGIAVEQVIVWEEPNELGVTHAHKLLRTVTGQDENGLAIIRRKSDKVAESVYDYQLPTQAEVEERVRKFAPEVKVHFLV